MGGRGATSPFQSNSGNYSEAQMIDALERFTSNKYSEIRKVQQGESIVVKSFNIKTKERKELDVTEKYKDYAQAIEQFISEGTGYKGVLYRGLAVDDATLDSFKVGRTISQNGLSSWTAIERTAQNFSERVKPSENRTNSVVIVEQAGSRRARNADKYSMANTMDGNEYIQSSKNRQLIQRIEKKNGITYLYVIEK